MCDEIAIYARFDSAVKLCYHFYMYGIYGDIISAAEKAIADFDETKELLEYPEVQADKAYYLSVLSKYNELNFLKDRLTALKNALIEERKVSSLLTQFADGDEREAVYEEIVLLKRRASQLSVAIADALGCKHAKERAYCRFKLTPRTCKFGEQLFTLIKDYLLSRGAKIENEKSEYAKDGTLSGIIFFAEGEDIITRLLPLVGAHKVYISGAKSEELCFAVTPSEIPSQISENDLKIDVFHSHGAGGQNINKVETAVRVTHVPTGIVVTCQDERSQLKNKKRAIQMIEKRLRERQEQAEKKRIEADVYRQFCTKSTPISFDYAGSTMTDTRLKAFTRVPFPLADFSSYIDGLITL